MPAGRGPAFAEPVGTHRASPPDDRRLATPPVSRALRVIDARWPHVGRRIRQVAPCTAVALDSSGPVPTLRAFGLRLASAWDPEGEAAMQSAHLPDACESVTVFGIGMGYLPQAVSGRLCEGGTLEVVVLNVGLLRVLLDVLEEWAWLDHPGVVLRLPEECSTLPACWAVRVTGNTA